METIIFLCNGEAPYHTEKGVISNKELPEEIKDYFIKCEKPYKTQWSCGNSKFIKVGSRAYFKRSGNIGSNEPIGFIAAGHVIAAPKNYQLKLVNKSKYSDLSEAYIGNYDGCFAVYIQIDSVVDFELPLEQRYLKRLPQFQGVNFNFGGSGCRFDERVASYLDAEWEKYSLVQHRQERGFRLVDILVDKGDILRQNKDYQAAIDAYKSALEIDPKYAKAINKINICESILKRVKTQPVTVIEPVPPVPPPDENNLIIAMKELDEENFFESQSDVEAGKKIYSSIARRQGQSKFRETLLKAYSYKCAISNFDAEAALEAAHIIPYIETENNHPSNGLLLRADLHTLFDLNLIAINSETMKVYIHPSLNQTKYGEIEGRVLQVPKDEAYRPKREFLQKRFNQCEWCKNI